MNISKWTQWLVNWVDASDPGGVRTERAVRAGIAALTSWLVALLLVGALTGGKMPLVTLFAVLVTILSVIAVNDLKRRDRNISLVLGGAAFFAGVVLASLLHGIGWIFPIMLLVMVFGAFASRRYGLRSGEVALLLMMGYYFAHLAQVRPDNLLWFGLSVLIGVASLWIWQSLLFPYHPLHALQRINRAFFVRAAKGVGMVADALATPERDAAQLPALERELKLMRRTHSVSKDLFPGVLVPAEWSAAQVGQLRLALFGAEQGFAKMVDGIRHSSETDAMPDDLRAQIVENLYALQVAISQPSAQSVSALEGAARELQTDVRARVRAFREAAAATGKQAAPPAWVAGALELVGGAYQLAQSARRVKVASESAHDVSASSAPAAAKPAPGSNPPGASPPAPMPKLGRLHLHPTLLLAIQAVIATALGMVVASLLGVAHVNWVFWTALTVLAGSSGESLRRMSLRVVGTTAGVFIGVALVLLLPPSVTVTVLTLTICIMLMVFFERVSYPIMILWLNVGFVLVFAQMGGDARNLLYSRTITTLLGAIVAAVTVLYIFPVRITGRFVVAANRFLSAVDDYVAAFVALMNGHGDEESLAAAQAQVDTTYAFIEQTLPSVLLENNILLQAESPISRQATKLAAIEAELGRLGEAAAAYDPADASAVNGRILQRLQDAVHASILAIVNPAGDGMAKPVAPLQPTPNDTTGAVDGSPLQLAGGAALYRIQATLRQIEGDFVNTRGLASVIAGVGRSR